MTFPGKKKDSDRKMKINLCRLIRIKNKTNSTRQWCFSWELERSLHYKILITTNKDPRFIDPLAGKRKGIGQWTAPQPNFKVELLPQLRKNKDRVRNLYKNWIVQRGYFECSTAVPEFKSVALFFLSAAWWLLWDQESQLEQGFE